MPELKKLETSAAFTPAEGNIVEYFAEENGSIVLKVKKSDGTEQTLSGGSVIAASVEYYKCASVDTSAKTWTGYKAVLSDGVYYFEESASTGLTYGNAYTPEIGSVYNNDASVKVYSLWQSDNPTYFIPLNSASETCETGQILTTYDSPEYTVIAGVSCANIQNGSFSVPDTDISVDDFSWMCKFRIFDECDTTGLIWFGTDSVEDFGIWLTPGGGMSIGTSSNYGRVLSVPYTFGRDKWYDLHVSKSNTSIKVFIDGEHVLSETFAIAIRKSGQIGIGRYAEYASNLPVYISDVKIYNEARA